MTKTSEILGRKEPCIFSKEGINYFRKGEPCRSKCDGYNIICENYLPNKCVYQSQGSSHTSKRAISQRLVNMPYDNHKGFELIRRLNDGGAI